MTPANGLAANGKLTITTTVPSSAAAQQSVPRPLQGIALISVGLLLFLPKRRLILGGVRSLVLTLFLISGLISLSGCGQSSSSPSGPSTNKSGTPSGTQVVTVSATDSSGKLVHSASFQIVVQ
jgi:hypothetical protein